jgi:hypothetical protein
MVSTLNKKNLNLNLNTSLSGNTWPYATGFQPMGALGVAEQRGFKAMF